jgi:hypothetical protein
MQQIVSFHQDDELFIDNLLSPFLSVKQFIALPNVTTETNPKFSIRHKQDYINDIQLISKSHLHLVTESKEPESSHS